jgi:hypothetical protein
MDEFVPTDAFGGSIEKIEILRSRLEKGLPLWHPNDNKSFQDQRIDGRDFKLLMQSKRKEERENNRTCGSPERDQ